MVFAPLAQSLMVGRKFRVAKSSNNVGCVKRPLQVGRTSFQHVYMRAFKVARLTDRSIDSRVGNKLLAIFEARNLSRFAEDVIFIS